MTYSISQTDPAKLTTEDLIAEIGGFKELAAKTVKRLSLILKELNARRVKHDLMRDRIMRFWEDLAEDRLDPEAAIRLGNRELIKCILPLPRHEQIAIATDKPVPVAVKTDTGEIKSDDRPLRLMDRATMKRAFGPDGIRTVHEQSEMIRAAGRVRPSVSVIALPDEMMIKVGREKVRPEDLRGPLLALGYTIEMTRRAKMAGTSVRDS